MDTPGTISEPRNAPPFPVPDPSYVCADAGPAGADEKLDFGSERRLKVLVVDDDAIELRLLAKHLTARGHEVTSAKDGHDALERALADPPHLIITDLMMPEMDGISLCRNLRKTKLGQQIYVLMLTGCEEEERVLEAFDAGVDDYLIKPFRPKSLLAGIRAGQRIIQLQREVDLDREELARYAAELAEVNRRLQQAAFTDALTGLPNRRFAMERLQQFWFDATRRHQPLTCLMIDIDHFKRVNDSYGHDAGDAVLRETATVPHGSSRTAGALRNSDLVCRLGGEEFLVLCQNTDAPAAHACAERLRRLVSQHPIQTAGLSLQVTISVGLASRAHGMRDSQDLLKAADTAVYAAKQGGRNRVCVAEYSAAQPLPC